MATDVVGEKKKRENKKGNRVVSGLKRHFDYREFLRARSKQPRERQSRSRVRVLLVFPPPTPTPLAICRANGLLAVFRVSKSSNSRPIDTRECNSFTRRSCSRRRSIAGYISIFEHLQRANVTRAKANIHDHVTKDFHTTRIIPHSVSRRFQFEFNEFFNFPSFSPCEKYGIGTSCVTYGGYKNTQTVKSHGANGESTLVQLRIGREKRTRVFYI